MLTETSPTTTLLPCVEGSPVTRMGLRNLAKYLKGEVFKSLSRIVS